MTDYMSELVGELRSRLTIGREAGFVTLDPEELNVLLDALREEQGACSDWARAVASLQDELKKSHATECEQHERARVAYQERDAARAELASEKALRLQLQGHIDVHSQRAIAECERADAATIALATSRALCDELRKACAEKEMRIGELAEIEADRNHYRRGVANWLAKQRGEGRHCEGCKGCGDDSLIGGNYCVGSKWIAPKHIIEEVRATDTLRDAEKQRADAAEVRVREFELEQASHKDGGQSAFGMLLSDRDEWKHKANDAEKIALSWKRSWYVRDDEAKDAESTLERVRGLAMAWLQHGPGRDCGAELLAVIGEKK